MAGSLKHSVPVSILRAIVLGSFFFVGCIGIVLTQYLGLKVVGRDADTSRALINATKKQFIAIFVFITSIIAPARVTFSFDEDQLPKSTSFKVDKSGRPQIRMAPNSVIISNHQIYTDWLYLWFLAYLSRIGDSVYIMLKDLSKLPILGYGMKNFNFLFLSRKWDRDKYVLTNQLLSIDADARGMGPSNGVKQIVQPSSTIVTRWPPGTGSNRWPFEVILFPEGTVVSQKTRARSDKFCDTKGIPRLKYTLLPRVRGLFLTLVNLRNSAEYLYDLTCGYSDLKAGQCGEDVFSLKNVYLFGHSPRVINYHVKVWKLSEIPLGSSVDNIDGIKDEDLERFENWLFERWYEKDKLLANFYETGEFESIEASEKEETLTTVNIPFGVTNYLDILGAFSTLFLLALLLKWVWNLALRFFFN